MEGESSCAYRQASYHLDESSAQDGHPALNVPSSENSGPGDRLLQGSAMPHPDDVRYTGATRADLLRPDFYDQANWLEIWCEVLFHIRRRRVTIQSELYCGVIQFISCLYVLAVIPQQMQGAGYDKEAVICITAAVCGVGSILCGFIANLPIIVAPPTAVSIFFAIFIQENNMTAKDADVAVVGAGILLILLGYRPLGRLISFFIPNCLQVGVAVGIGMFTALAGSTDIQLVVPGNYTIVAMGPTTPEIMVAMSGLVIITVALHYHVKAAFCYSIIFTTLVWWTYKNEWPQSVVRMPSLELIDFQRPPGTDTLLTLDICLLNILFINGLICTLGDLAQLTRPKDGSIPRSRWLFVVCGVVTILSGCCGGPPVLISPESSAGIKAGARTGLSTVVCGILFLLAIFFSPVFEQVPSAGTAGVLIMIGALLFQNVNKVDWTVIRDAVPTFCSLFYIATTYSILRGAAVGYATYVIINTFTGDLELAFRQQLHMYLHPNQYRKQSRAMSMEFGDDYDGGGGDGNEDDGDIDALLLDAAETGKRAADDEAVRNSDMQRSSEKPTRSYIAGFFSRWTAEDGGHAMDQVDENVAINMGYTENSQRNAPLPTTLLPNHVSADNLDNSFRSTGSTQGRDSLNNTPNSAAARRRGGNGWSGGGDFNASGVRSPHGTRSAAPGTPVALPSSPAAAPPAAQVAGSASTNGAPDSGSTGRGSNTSLGVRFSM